MVQAQSKCIAVSDHPCRVLLHVFAVEVRGDDVYLQLPPEEVLDAALATDLHCIRVCPSRASEPAAAATLA